MTTDAPIKREIYIPKPEPRVMPIREPIREPLVPDPRLIPVS